MSGVVKVKPIVWDEDEDRGYAYGGRYSVMLLSHEQYLLHIDQKMEPVLYESMEMAKRAAFLHHERYVLSALE